MKLTTASDGHLTYCLNVHPGETWTDNVRAIRRYALPVRDRVGPGRAFGLGLRLSRRAADALSAPARLRAFREFLRIHDLYVPTVNGFPYGRFHRQAVKQTVYRPDWRAIARVRYTERLGDVLAALGPADVPASISTVPGGYKPDIRGPEDRALIVRNLMRAVAHLRELRRRTGRDICLALEPEPDCLVETAEEVIRFFDDWLLPLGTAELRRTHGLRRRDAEPAIRRHLGVCLDTCHVAVQFEDPLESLLGWRAAGVRVPKIQVSAAVTASGAAVTGGALAAFRDEVYLHQARVRDRGGRVFVCPDLPLALAGDWPPGSEVRCHFHVPLYWKGTRVLRPTTAALTPAFWAAATREADHLEIETYTFHVLPADLRTMDVTESIVREYTWLLGRLRRAGCLDGRTEERP